MEEDSKENFEKIVGATVKGGISAVPIIGGVISEYIGLAQERIRDKRLNEWMKLVDEKLKHLETDIDKLSSNEVFYSCFQNAFFSVSKTYEKDKRTYFANALINSISNEISDEKKMIFLNLLDRFTLSHIVLLNFFNHPHSNNNESTNKEVSSIQTKHCGGTTNFIKYLCEQLPQFELNEEYLKLIVQELITNGLIEEIDWRTPKNETDLSKKRTTKLGDEFLGFLK